MNKFTKKKKALIVLLTILALLFIAGLYANVLIANLIKSNLASQVEKLENATLKYGDINVDLFTRSASVTELCYISDSTKVDLPMLYNVAINELFVDYIHLYDILVNKELNINQISLNDANFDIHVLHSNKNDTVKKMYPSKELLEFIESFGVGNVYVNNTSVKFDDKVLGLYLKVDSLYLHTQDLNYHFGQSKLVNYNDSIYNVEFKNLKLLTGFNENLVTVKSFSTKNSGPLLLSDLEYKCLVSKYELAAKKGGVPTVWSHLLVRKVETSPINILRSVIKEKIKLESLNVDIAFVDMFKDNRFLPVKVERPFQVLLNETDFRIGLKSIKVKVDKFNYSHIERKSPTPGELSLSNISLDVKDLDNKPNNIINAAAKVTMPQNKGTANMWVTLDMNPAATWSCRTVVNNLDLSALNTFVKPIAGINVYGNVNKLEANYKGDTIAANGTFTMIYDNMRIEAFPSSSIELIAKNYKAINNIANNLITKCNPKKKGQEPKSYYVSSKRLFYRPYMLHLISPLVTGATETALSAFFLNKQIKDWNTQYDKHTKTYKEKEKQKLLNKQAKRLEKSRKKQQKK